MFNGYPICDVIGKLGLSETEDRNTMESIASEEAPKQVRAYSSIINICVTLMCEEKPKAIFFLEKGSIKSLKSVFNHFV